MSDPHAPCWADLDAAPRVPAAAATAELVPGEPGVYAWYRAGERVYVGKADSLRNRICRDHLGRSRAPTGSAFRRNVAEELGFGAPGQIKSGALVLTPDQLAEVRAWIMACEVAWLTCATKADALALETRLKAEFQPRLTKR